jgi:hypothetical protein
MLLYEFWYQNSVILNNIRMAGGYKETLSILADQLRPRIWAQMRGEGGSYGASANEYSCTQEPKWT